MSKNITLQVKIPSEIAISILGRLYGGGYITKDQYETKIKKIDVNVLIQDKKKRIKMNKMLLKTSKNKYLF